MISMNRMNNAGPYSDNWRKTTNYSFTIGDFTDGLSNTAAFSESLVSDGSEKNRDERRNLHYTPSGMIEQYDAYIDAVVRDGLANPINWGYWTMWRGLSWAYSDAWEKHVYAHVFPPNAPPIMTYEDNTFVCHEGDGGMNPTSNHPGGVNLAMFDGSVRFIKNTVSLPAWWALGTRNGGEVISADSY
jgi:prepilin-type processing-associated H-X9-DG protein